MAAHALAQQQQQHAASQFRPNSGGHSAADKRVLSILRNSLEERSNQQKLMLAAQQQQQQQQQQQNAAAAGNMAAQHRSQGPRPALDHSHLLRQHMQASPQAALPLPAMVQELPPSSGPQHSSSELDGLAAFLAAQIWKMMGLEFMLGRSWLKLCGDAHQSLQATPGGGAAAPGAAHRTRGDCPCGEDNCGCPVQSMTLAVTSRKVSETRSSTETSVFDFPDSDPEMAAPASDCPPGASTPGPSAAAAPPPPPPVEEDPAWASLCTNFVTSLETKGAKTSRAGIQALNTARKRKAEASEEPSKVPKLEVKVELPKPEPKVLKEEMELIESCLKVSSDCEKLLETIPPIPKLENNSDSDVVNKKSSRKIVVESSSSSESESDSEESLSLAARQQQRLQEFLSSSESSNSSSEDSDWSDDIGKAAAVRLRERNTRNKSRAYSIRTRLRSQRNSPPAKRPGRPRRKIVKSPSSDSEEEKSESPKPRRTRQRHSPSPMSTRKTRRKSKSPVSTITTRLRNKSKSPARKKSKSPPLTRQTRRKSKSPEPKKQSPISTTVKKSKSPPPVATRQSRRQSKSPVTSSKDPGFYPGWDSDLVKFKQSWRMPSNLIMVHSRPNSDPPTPTKKRRGCTNSPISCASDPGISGNLRSLASRKILRDFDTSDSSNSTPVKIRKPMIRDVELSDSSNSLPFRPRRTESSSAKPLKDRQELFAKLTDKIKGRGRKKQLECEEEEEEAKITREESDDDKKPKLRRGLRQRRRSSRLSGSLDKRLLRSAALHRSNRALINSKRHLRRRDLKASEPVIVRAKRGPKGRRKLRSSGFDYLRKKKKKKEERETKRVIGIPGLRQVSGSVEEVANEVRAWVVNKGLGETVLHQAARKNHDDSHLCTSPQPEDSLPLLACCCCTVPESTAALKEALAAECGHVEVCRLLLSYGADPGLAKYSGATPLMLASTPEVWQLLKDHIADMQGTPASPWDLRHQWNIEDPPTSPPALSDHDFDFEDVSSEHAMTAPASWWLPGESEPLMLLLEVCSTLGHGLDWLRRALRSDVTTKDIPRSQFNETARPVQLLATNWKPNRQLCVSEPNQNDTLLTLIRADDKLRSLLEAASYARSRASR
ncbi:hypothetical protein B566_EDAN012210 [Ephemera danica]|nr:hypothetical protein B566_EDAN012210 [Ephemera danica]